MRLATLHHRRVQGFLEIAEERLVGGVVGDLFHHVLILPDFVADGVRVVDQIVCGQALGNEQVIQPGNDLREPFLFFFSGCARAERRNRVETACTILDHAEVLLLDHR